jgi:hypothetical protein
MGWRAWKVLDAWLLKRSWDVQEGVVQAVDGTHRSALPVSKQVVRGWGGVPSVICP